MGEPMKRKGDGSHGAVSVFLAIILIPCMVFTCIFGDLSRVQLSMAATESAGDLALYSLLARYDEELKEYYGLVASCQDINKFYDVTATYFEGMLAAEGVSGEGSQLFLEYLRELQQEGYADFLRSDLSGITVGAADNGALGGNPALIEDGIVEFMKYRGPVQLTSKLIKRFSDLDFENQITEVEKNKQVTDAKEDYAEKQGELLDKAFYTYLAIREYEKVQQSTDCPDMATYQALEQDLKKISDDLLGVTTIITEYYFPGTENLRQITKPFLNISDYTVEKDSFAIQEEDSEGNEIYCLDKKLLDELLDGLDEELESIQKTADDFVKAYEDIGSPVKGVNYVVYCLKVQRVIEESNLVTGMKEKGKTLLQRYAKLKAATECEPLPEGDDLPADWQQQLSDACTKIEKLYDSCLKESGKSQYLTDLNEYIKKAAEVVPKVQSRGYTFSSQLTGNQGETLDGFASRMSGYLNGLRTSLQEQIDRLDVAIDGGTLPNGKAVSSLDELLQKAEEFTVSRDAWGTAANNSNTAYGDSEYDLYQGATAVAEGGSSEDKEVEGEKIAAQINRESVMELKNRLEHIRSDMQSCLDTLNNITYGGTKLQELTSGDALISAAHTAVPENTQLSLDAAKDAARGYFQSLMQPSGDSLYQAPAQDNAASGNEPDLNRQTPQLYKFLKELLQENESEVEKEIEDNEKRNEECKKQGEEAESKAKEVGAYLENMGSDLQDVSGGEKVGALSALTSVVSVVNNLMNGSGDELRDQLYVCEYIMDMFSYSTFDNEGKYNLANDASKGSSVTFQDYPYSQVKDDWAKEDPQQIPENQSLTNVPINHSHNHAFLGEVEYILYGSASIKSNLAEAYANIFAIREMLNVVSGFCNFYSNAKINSIAAGVATATAGIVPIPVTKCVLILVLSTLESAKDLERLKAGAPVELYKVKATDWYYNVDGGFPPSENTIEKESGLYYSDYMYIFLLIGLTGETTYPSMLRRVGDLIQANMRIATDDGGYSLGKSLCYFRLQGTVRVKPLMMTLPIVDTVDGASGMREKTDWCTYKIDMIRGYS